MGKRKTTEEFIEKAILIHGNKYNYSKVNYINNITKIEIICQEHGSFYQTPTGHFNNSGCDKCAIKKSRSTTEAFITKASEIHGNKYDYSKVEYINVKNKVEIICKIHGHFFQTPNDHLSKKGCIMCGGTHCLDKKSFIKKSKEIHKNKYTYDKVVYKNSDTGVVITCPKHGDFLQKPKGHKRGQGCPSCANINKSTSTWKYSKWEEQGLKSKNFDGFKIYIIKLTSPTEEFLKIGKTFVPLKHRFSGTRMPYNYKVIKVLEFMSGIQCSKAEEHIKRIYKKHSYVPYKMFSGKYECFSGIENLNL